LEKCIHFAGGEPLLYFDKVLEAAKHGKELGFKISIVTNGFWAYSVDRAREQIRQLKAAGLYRVELSSDHFHQKFIPIETIQNAIQILKQFEIPTILRVVTTKKHMIDETLKKLRVEDLDGLSVSGSPMVPNPDSRTEVVNKMFLNHAKIHFYNE